MTHSFSKRMILITIILMDFLSGMEFDLFVPSFPTLQAQFDLSPFWVEALLSVNFFGYFISLFWVGGLADRYGRKPVILAGIITFIIGTLLCLGAESYALMFIGRFLQGVGIAAPAILSFLIIADSYSLKEQQYWMAMLNGIMNMSVGAAPVLGSYITLYFDWQGNFVALLFLGLLALGMTIFFIPHYKLSVHKEPLSLSGFIPLFQSKPLMLLSMTMVFIFLPYWIFSGISPVLYMEGLGVSLSHFGYYQGVLAIGFALGSVGLGLLIKKHDQKTILSFSNPLFILSLMVMCVITIIDTKSPLLITLALTLFVTAQIIPSTLLYPVCLNFIPRAKGRISAIIQGARLILSVFFLQMAGYFYQGSFQNVGIMLSLLMIPIIIALYMVLKNRELMQFAEKN